MPKGDTGAMTDHQGPDNLSRTEIGKDAVQSTVEAAASTVGQVATIVTKAVQDVAGALGGLATEVFEIRDAARNAAADQDPDPTPKVDPELI